MERREFLRNSLAVVAGLTLCGLEGQFSAMASGAAETGNLTSVPIENVMMKDSFWSPKIEVWRHKTIADCFKKFVDTGALENFDRVATHQTGGHHGDPWWDGLIYEMITGVSGFLAAQRDPALEKQIDGCIDRIAAAAAVDPDGYINTAVTLSNVAPRWSDPPTLMTSTTTASRTRSTTPAVWWKRVSITTARRAKPGSCRLRHAWRTTCAASWDRRPGRISSRAMPSANCLSWNSICYTGTIPS